MFLGTLPASRPLQAPLRMVALLLQPANNTVQRRRPADQ
jgi:hypothetical protein